MLKLFMSEKRVNPDTGLVEEKHWHGWVPCENSGGHQERVNPDTGIHEEKHWHGWSEKENSEGRQERVNPDTGIHEEKHWHGWDSSENPEGREERINPETGIHEEKHWHGWTEKENSKGDLRSNPKANHGRRSEFKSSENSESPSTSGGGTSSGTNQGGNTGAVVLILIIMGILGIIAKSFNGTSQSTPVRRVEIAAPPTPPQPKGMTATLIKTFAAANEAVTSIVVPKRSSVVITASRNRVCVWTTDFAKRNGCVDAERFSSPLPSDDGNLLAILTQWYKPRDTSKLSIENILPTPFTLEAIKVHNLIQGGEPAIFFTSFGDRTLWTMSHDGSKLAVYTQESLSVYSLSDLRTPIWQASASYVGALRFSTDDKSLIFASKDQINFVDARNGAYLSKLPGGARYEVSEIDQSPDHRQLLLVKGGWGGWVKIVNNETGGDMYSIEGWDRAYCISADWNILAITAGSKIEFFKIASAANIGSINFPDAVDVRSISFGRDNRQFYGGNFEGNVFVWALDW